MEKTLCRLPHTAIKKFLGALCLLFLGYLDFLRFVE